MDKKLTELNPKLKEIYERVMSTKISASSPNTQSPAPDSEKPKQSPANINPAQMTSVTVNQSSVKSPIKKTAKKSSPILLIITAVIFFLAYSFFWIRFFSFKLPFNLPF